MPREPRRTRQRLVLRHAGIDAVLDLLCTDARQDWYYRAIREMTDADFVLVVPSERYRATGDGPNTENRGIHSEAALLRELVYTDRAVWLLRCSPSFWPATSHCASSRTQRANIP
jgi:hypothetical protein